MTAGYAQGHPGQRIRVDTDLLVVVGNRLQAAAGGLEEVHRQVLALGRALDVEMRQKEQVQADVARALAMLRGQASTAAAMARFLLHKAQAFDNADQAALGAVAALTGAAAAAVKPLPPATGLFAPGTPLSSYLRCGSLIAPAPAAADPVSVPAWVVRAGGALKIAAGWTGAAGGLVVATGLVASGLGIVAAPVFAVAWMHAAASMSTGTLELALGEEQENPLLPFYNRVFGDKRGATAYETVDWGLTLLGVGTVARKIYTKEAALLAARTVAASGRSAARQALRDLGREGMDLAVDLANKGDLPKRIYQRTRGRPQPAGG